MTNPEDPGAGDDTAQDVEAGAGPDEELRPVTETMPVEGLDNTPTGSEPEPVEDENPGPPEHAADDGDLAPEDDGTDDVAEGTHEPDEDETEPVE